MKKDVLDGAYAAKLARMDLDKKEDMLSVKKIDVGFASTAIIDKLEKDNKVSQLQLLTFYTRVPNLSQINGRKVVERSPLKFSIVGCLSALDPRILVRQPETAGMKKLLSILLSLR